VFRRARGWINLTPLTAAAISIRTPDQRLRVFVSSTLQELSAERAAVSEAVRAIRLTPVMFELGARPHPPRDLYRAYLAQSDVFVGIYWQRYGWVAPGEAISGLEDEYLLSGAMPKLIYIKRGDAREPRLDDLIKRIQADDRASYRPFAEVDELRELVKDDLAVMLTERFAAAGAAGARTGAGAAPAPAGASAPAQADIPHRYELPLERGELIGRAALVASIAELLARPEVGIVTLTGPGGTGKTRLAIHLGHAQAAGFDGNVYYVELAGVRSAQDVLPAIQTTLEIPLPEGGDPEKQIIAHLRRQRALLILDNFEQVLDAAPAIARIAAACPQLKLLVTSRESLRVQGEHEQPVPPLALDPVGDRALSPAMTLFEQRAQEMRPDFRIDAANQASVAEICRRLDGLPLAVELAAARARVLTPQAMLPRLDQSLSLLTSQRRDLPARQQTLRAALAWSYDLLRPDEQAFFRRLGVFTGGFFEEAAAEITAGSGVDALDGLTSLADKSLLARAEQDGVTRFHLLETVREFAVERLGEAGDDRDTRLRHARWVRDLLRDAQGPVSRHAERLVWRPRLALEEGNTRAALRFASSTAGDRALLWDLFCKFAFCLLVDARTREVRELYDELRPGGEAEDPVLAAVAREEGIRGFDPNPGFAPMLEAAVSLLEGAGDRVYLPSALVSYGMTLMVAAPERALPPLVRAVDLAVEARQARVESWARTIVFWCHMGAGDLEAAGRAADALVSSARASGEPEGQAFGRTSQGRLSVLRGDLTAARQHFAEAAALSRDKDAFWSRADALTCLCSTTMALGDASASRQILEEALVFLVPLRIDGVAFLFGPLAKLLADAGERDRAVRVLSVVPATLDAIGPMTLMRADPTGSLTRATREVLAALGPPSTKATDGGSDLDAALHAALDRS
jgi:predicted ATPase